MPVTRSSARSSQARPSSAPLTNHDHLRYVTSTISTRRSGNENYKIDATEEDVTSLPSVESVIKEFIDIGKRLQQLPRERLVFDESTPVIERCKQACYFRDVDPHVLGVTTCVTRSGKKARFCVLCLYDGEEDDDILSYSFSDSHTHTRHARTRAHTVKLAWILRIDPNCLRKKLLCPACGKDLDTERADRIRVHMLSQHPDVLEKYWPHPLKDPETLVQELCQSQKSRANNPVNRSLPLPTPSIPALSRSSSTVSLAPSISYSTPDLGYPCLDPSTSYVDRIPQWSLYAHANPPYRGPVTDDPMLWDKNQASMSIGMVVGGDSFTLQQGESVFSGDTPLSSQIPYMTPEYWDETQAEEQRNAHTNFFPSYAANHNTHWQTEMPFALGPQTQYASTTQSACDFSYL